MATDVLQQVWQEASKVHDAIRSVNIPEPAASYAVYQSYFESGAYKDYKYSKYNNPSGVKYFGQPNAKAGNNQYAIYPTLRDWAADMKNILSKGVRPIDAKTLDDYSNRLKQNRYYEADPKLYLSGLERARLVLKSIPATMSSGTSANNTAQNWQPKDVDIPGSAQPQKDWKQQLEDLPLPFKIGGALLIVLIVKKVLD